MNPSFSSESAPLVEAGGTVESRDRSAPDEARVEGDGPQATHEIRPADALVNILLVDDEARNLDVLESILQSPDYCLVRAQKADDALMALIKGEFAVIVLDIQMPGMSGLELANLVKQRKRTQHIPIIFLTAYFQADTDVLRGYSVGAVDYLTKPVNPEILKSKVSVFVDLFRKSRALALTNVTLEMEIAQRHKATVQLRETNNQLEELVYSIAHDLRGPLRAMQGCSELLLDECAVLLDNAGREYAERINKSALFMDKLLLDLLEYGRMGRAEFQLAAVHAAAAWNAAVYQCQHLIQEKEALLEMPSPLPAVRAHEGTLAQVFANLLSNALRFVPGEVRPHIRLRAERRGAMVRLWVEDNGIGIPEEHHDRIFRVFEQLDRSTYGGTGIGLAIVRKGMERMGGRAGVESRPGEGSRFWIELAGTE